MNVKSDFVSNYKIEQVNREINDSNFAFSQQISILKEEISILKGIVTKLQASFEQLRTSVELQKQLDAETQRWNMWVLENQIEGLKDELQSAKAKGVK